MEFQTRYIAVLRCPPGRSEPSDEKGRVAFVPDDDWEKRVIRCGGRQQIGFSLWANAHVCWEDVRCLQQPLKKRFLVLPLCWKRKACCHSHCVSACRTRRVWAYSFGARQRAEGCRRRKQDDTHSSDLAEKIKQADTEVAGLMRQLQSCKSSDEKTGAGAAGIEGEGRPENGGNTFFAPKIRLLWKKYAVILPHSAMDFGARNDRVLPCSQR